MKFHPLANLLPLLEGEEFDGLVADIKANGLLNPIVRKDGLIIDGRNRFRACEKLEVPPAFIEFDGLNLNSTPEEYIWSQNIARRHLTGDQRAAIALQWADRIKADAQKRQRAHLKTGTQKPVVENSPPREKTRDRLAAMAHVGVHKIRVADTINRASQDLLQQVASGKIRLRDAARQAAEREREQRLLKKSGEDPQPNDGSPGWTYWGLEAGSGPDVLPLESLWRSARGQLEGISRDIEAAFQKDARSSFPHTIGHLPTSPDPGIAAIPGVAEAFQELERIKQEHISQFRQAVNPVVARFRQLATTAPDTPVCPCRDHYRKKLSLTVNARQKNGRGACGLPGCWNAIESGKRYCSEHGESAMTERVEKGESQAQVAAE